MLHNRIAALIDVHHSALVQWIGRRASRAGLPVYLDSEDIAQDVWLVLLDNPEVTPYPPHSWDALTTTAGALLEEAAAVESALAGSSPDPVLNTPIEQASWLAEVAA